MQASWFFTVGRIQRATQLRLNLVEDLPPSAAISAMPAIFD
jgi:hypothetical protein